LLVLVLVLLLGLGKVLKTGPVMLGSV